MRNRLTIVLAIAILCAPVPAAQEEPIEPTEDEAAILEVVMSYWVLCGVGALGEDDPAEDEKPDNFLEFILRDFGKYIQNLTETQIDKHVRAQMADDHEHIRKLFGKGPNEELGITMLPSALTIAFPPGAPGGAVRSGTIDCMPGLSEDDLQELREYWGVFELRSNVVESLPFPMAWMRFDMIFTPEEIPAETAVESSPQLFRQRRWLTLVKHGKWKITDDFRGPIPPTDDDAVFQPITVMQNATPAKLADLNWVYGAEGATAVTLPGGHEAFETYLAETNTPHPSPPPSYFKLPPNPAMRDRAFELVEPNLGDSFCVMFANNAMAESLTLTGVGCMPSGDGGVSGFVGILENPREPIESEWFRPIGIAIRQSECGFETLDLSIPENQRERLKAFAKDFLQADRLNRVLPFYIHRPDTVGVLLNVTFGDCDVLIGAYQNDEGTWLPIPFPAPVLANPNGFVLEDPKGENDVAPHASTVHVMPDIDHNGTSEVFIRSTVSFLFTLAFDASGTPNGFKAVNSAYVGP